MCKYVFDVLKNWKKWSSVRKYVKTFDTTYVLLDNDHKMKMLKILPFMVWATKMNKNPIWYWHW